MKIRLMGLALALGALVGWVVACDTDQPPGACKASHSTNYGIFKLTSAPDVGECSTLTGDFVSMSKYNPPGTTDNKLALSVWTLAGKLLGDERVQDFATLTHVGDYPNEPTNGVCVAENINPVSVDLPQLGDPADGGKEAVRATYRFSNVSVVSTPLVPGTQWTADLEYTAGGCTATYSVVGISPLVTCHTDLEDGGIEPDNQKCQPLTLPDGGQSAAVSDLTDETTNFAFDLVCDPTPRACTSDDFCEPGQLIMVCAPNGPVPALR
jgi:hypothetical protein